MSDADYIDETTDEALNELVERLQERFGASLDAKIQKIKETLVEQQGKLNVLKESSKNLSDEAANTAKDLRELQNLTARLQKAAADGTAAVTRVEAQLEEVGQEARAAIIRLNKDFCDILGQMARASALDEVANKVSALESQGRKAADVLRRTDQRVGSLVLAVERLTVIIRWLAIALSALAAVWLSTALLFR